ncbi:MAG: helix-turn-helix domain-containing protein [Pseudomonadota bacterium]
MPAKLFTSIDAAEYLGISEKQLVKFRRQGGGPTVTVMSCGGARGRPRYKVSDLDEWLANLTTYKTHDELLQKEAGGVS